jgi:hypothetical protein
MKKIVKMKRWCRKMGCGGWNLERRRVTNWFISIIRAERSILGDLNVRAISSLRQWRVSSEEEGEGDKSQDLLSPSQTHGTSSKKRVEP